MCQVEPGMALGVGSVLGKPSPERSDHAQPLLLSFQLLLSSINAFELQALHLLKPLEQPAISSPRVCFLFQKTLAEAAKGCKVVFQDDSYAWRKFRL